ncbi:MAG: endolytic transglycosylase MltG [Patescibacteria group bacterium]
MANRIKFKRRQIWLVVLIGLIFYLWYQLAWPQFFGSKPRSVTIEQGDSSWTIASKLKEVGAIKNRLFFFVSVWWHDGLDLLKAGQYAFDGGSNLGTIVKKLIGGDVKVDDIIVLIPEGFNLREVGERIRTAGFTKAGDIYLESFRAADFYKDFPWLEMPGNKKGTLEGFIFPDTYRFDRSLTSYQIVARMLKNFEVRTAALRNQLTLKNRDFYGILIMASILEKEVPHEDMPVAAGVLWKRLELGMPLQADATLVYALGRPIRRSDTTTLDSAYNSYLYKGLPPTPISNPSLEAIKAALSPQTSNYLYYLTRASDGKTVFSRTLEEHNLARAKYLQSGY